MYKALQDRVEVTAEKLKSGSVETRKLHRIKDSLHLHPDSVLEARVASHDKPRWCTVCPPAPRTYIVWTTHAMAHSGVGRTTSRLQLTWHWPGMTSMVRKNVKKRLKIVKFVNLPSMVVPKVHREDSGCMPDDPDSRDNQGQQLDISLSGSFFKTARCIGHPRCHSNDGSFCFR